MKILITYFIKDMESMDIFDLEDSIKRSINYLKNESIDECINEIIQSEEKRNRLCVDEKTRIFEKIYDFCTHYANLQTRLVLQKSEVLRRKNSNMEEIAKKIHEKLNAEYKKRLNMRENSKNIWITFKENQRLFVSLGVINSDSGRFVEMYKELVKRLSEDSIQKKVDELVRLYEEIFADLAMCEAFDFSANAYVMYSIHIFMKERNFPEEVAYDMTLDRLCAVLFTKYESTYQMELKNAFNEYWADLRKILQEQTKDFSECITELKDENIDKLIKVSIQSLKLIRIPLHIQRHLANFGCITTSMSIVLAKVNTAGN